MSKKAVEKRKKHKQTKVMAFGTFDGLHLGHLNFFRQARALATQVPGQAKKLSTSPSLIVSVARDKNVFRIKGRRPVFNEKQRMALLKRTKVPDKVVLGGLTNHIAHILKERPDIIALGYDQKDYVQNLKKDLKEKGLEVKIVRLKPHKPHIYKNALLRPRK